MLCLSPQGAACGLDAAGRSSPSDPTAHVGGHFSLENFSAASRWDVDVLCLLHPVPRDFQIRFEEEGHRYFLGGAQCRGSVTALIHAFSHPFNSDEVIAKMRCSTNWPRAG